MNQPSSRRLLPGLLLRGRSRPSSSAAPWLGKTAPGRPARPRPATRQGMLLAAALCCGGCTPEGSNVTPVGTATVAEEEMCEPAQPKSCTEWCDEHGVAEADCAICLSSSSASASASLPAAGE